MTTEPIVRELVMNSRCKGGIFKLGTIVEDELILTMEQTAEDFLREELGEDSTDFLMAKLIIENSKGELDWDEFLKIVDMENGRIKGIRRLGFESTDFRGTEIQGIISEKVAKGELYIGSNMIFGGDDVSIIKVLKNEELNGDLDLRDTRITTMGKLKKVMGHLNLRGLKWLKSIGNLSSVGGDIKAQGANIELQLDIARKIKNKQLKTYSMNYLGGRDVDLNRLFVEKELEVGLDLSGTNITSLGDLEKSMFLILKGVKTLKSIGKMKKIIGFADFEGTSIELQKEVIGKMNSGKLKITGEALFGGNIEGIEQLLEFDFIPGDLDLKGTSKETQSKFKEKLLSKKMKVDGYAFFDDKIVGFKDNFYH